MPIEWVDIFRLLAATVAGAFIGLERELHHKPAGFRTNILICLGAAVFTIMSMRMIDVTSGFGDRSRIAAQIVTGVGFLGAGAIIHARRQVIGLTTAATIWTVASVGMAFGSGEYLLGSAATVLTVVVLFGLASAETWIARWRTATTIVVEIDGDETVVEHVQRLVRDSGMRCRESLVAKTGGGFAARFRLIGAHADLHALEGQLRAMPAVRLLRRRRSGAV